LFEGDVGKLPARVFQKKKNKKLKNQEGLFLQLAINNKVQRLFFKKEKRKRKK